MSSNNQLTKGDASAATSDSDSKMSVGKATGALAFVTLLKAQKEIDENGYLSPETHAEVLKFHFLCLKSSKELFSAAFDIDFNSSGRSTDSSSKEMSAVAYGLDNYTQHIKAFLASHGLNHLPPSYLALLDSMEASAQKAESSSVSLPKSVTTGKRKRNNEVVSGHVSKKVKDDEDQTIPMHGSGGNLQDIYGDDETVAHSNVSDLTDSYFGKPTIKLTNSDNSKRRIAMNSSKPHKAHEDVQCLCDRVVAACNLKKHCSASGITGENRGEGGINILTHAQMFMTTCRSKSIKELTWEESTCRNGLISAFGELLDPSSSKYTTVKKQAFLKKTESIFKRGVQEGALGPLLITCARHLLAPPIWETFKASLIPGGPAAKYVADLEMPTNLTRLPAAAASTSSANGGALSLLGNVEVSIRNSVRNSTSHPFSDEEKSPSLKSATSLATLGNKQAAAGATAPNAIDGTANTFKTPRRSAPTSSPPTLSTPGVGGTLIASGGTTTKPTAFNGIETTSPPTTAKDGGLLAQSAADATSNGGNTKVTSPPPPAEGGGLLNKPAADASSNGGNLLTHEQKMQYYDELKTLCELKEKALAAQNDRLVAKIDKESEALEAKVFPDF